MRKKTNKIVSKAEDQAGTQIDKKSEKNTDYAFSGTPFTRQNKLNFIVAMTANLGNVSITCQKVGIHRQTYYKWIADDPAFKSAVDDVSEVTLDFAENKLMSLMQAGNVAAVIFYLKTKGKHRGFIEKQEVELQGNEHIEVTIGKKEA